MFVRLHSVHPSIGVCRFVRSLGGIRGDSVSLTSVVVAPHGHNDVQVRSFGLLEVTIQRRLSILGGYMANVVRANMPCIMAVQSRGRASQRNTAPLLQLTGDTSRYLGRAADARFVTRCRSARGDSKDVRARLSCCARPRSLPDSHARCSHVRIGFGVLLERVAHVARGT